jgi:hypothetical protein
VLLVVAIMMTGCAVTTWRSADLPGQRAVRQILRDVTGGDGKLDRWMRYPAGGQR